MRQLSFVKESHCKSIRKAAPLRLVIRCSCPILPRTHPPSRTPPALEENWGQQVRFAQRQDKKMISWHDIYMHTYTYAFIMYIMYLYMCIFVPSYNFDEEIIRSSLHGNSKMHTPPCSLRLCTAMTLSPEKLLGPHPPFMGAPGCLRILPRAQ